MARCHIHVTNLSGEGMWHKTRHSVPHPRFLDVIRGDRVGELIRHRFVYRYASGVGTATGDAFCSERSECLESEGGESVPGRGL